MSEESPVSFRSSSAAETEKLGQRIAAGLHPGDVVVVSGELGTGKTTLIRGACRALGVTERVTSPTFTIGHRYRGRVPVSHLDLYRLEGLDREDPGLLDDYLDGESVALIEWPEAGDRQVEERVRARITIRHAGGDEREIETQYP
jgi:tRNA threonylcarbamoyladenosine biosynthesis protein TsaE